MRYRLRIANPMDRDVFVQTCTLRDPAIDVWAGGPPSGLFIPASGRIRSDAMSYVEMAKREMGDLAGTDASCTGLDWHGNLPA
jgi:hypothetical protein